MINPEEWKLVRDIFHEIVDISPEGRDAALITRLSDRPTLLKEVESLLKIHDSENDFLEVPVKSDTVMQSLSTHGTLDMSPGEKSGDFLILKELGRGSFGRVYLAHQISLGREVAIKVSLNFGDEGRTMANLEHDHIVKVFSETVDVARNTRVMCMQYVPGVSLERILEGVPFGKPLDGRQLLKLIDAERPETQTLNPMALKDRDFLRGADPLETGLWICLRLADALAYAHNRHVLHLDVKPGNVLMNPYGRPLLMDFNVAAREALDGRVQVTGGTLNYMAPEHVEAFQSRLRDDVVLTIDARADVYSLGVLLREIFAKTPRLNLPEEVSHIVGCATAFDVDKRYPNARSLGSALECALERHSILKRLPQPGRIMNFTLEYPFLSLLGFILVPQIFGSIVNIAYNSMMIVSRLNTEQQELFNFLLGIYNPLIYVPCFVLVHGRLKFVREFLRDRRGFLARDVAEADQLRRRLVGIPAFMSWVTTFGWCAGFVLFPSTIHLLRGPLEPAVFGHFLISFVLSSLIALTYSYLYTQFLVLRVLYPGFFAEGSQIRVSARRELASFWKGASIFQHTAGLVPLFSALMVIISTPLVLSPHDTAIFRGLLAAFVVMAMAGIAIAVRVSRVMSATLLALTSGE